MLGKSHRFSFKKGAPRRIYSTPLFVIRYDSSRDQLHLAVVVGKKVDKRAVYRNKIKRQVNAMLREILSTEFKYDIVFFIKKQIADTESSQVKEELKKALKVIKIIQ